MAAPVSEISPAQKDAAEKEIKGKQREVKYDLRDFTVDYLVKQFQDDLFYVPDYQREFIWPLRHQRRFIESILLGLPIPMMFVADMDDGRLEIVDGAQRIQSLEAFLNDDLILLDLDQLPSLNGFRFSDLPDAQGRKFGTRAMRIVVLEEPTSFETRQQIFDRINTSGVVATASEVRRGTLAGPFMTFLKDCSNDPLFLSLCPMSQSLKKRREGEELLLRLFAYSDRYLEFKHDVDGFLDEYAKEHQRKFDKKIMKREFDNVMGFVARHFPNGFAKKKGSKSTPRVRFEMIAVGVNLALRERPGLVPTTSPESWLGSDEFKYHTTTHASNSGPRLRGRVEYVRDQLLKGSK